MRPESKHLHAKGNLNYIQFLQLVQKMWIDAHPDVPLVAEGLREFPTYPIITYRLDNRQTIQQEPKPRFREEIRNVEGQPNYIIAAQRFKNLVTFSVFTKDNAQLAEEVIEAFEDFMIEFTPVLKEMGLSEILYARRLPDNTGDRGRGLGVTIRHVSYLVITEKIIKTTVQRLEHIAIEARRFIEEPIWVYSDATPATPISYEILDTFAANFPDDPLDDQINSNL